MSYPMLDPQDGTADYDYPERGAARRPRRAAPVGGPWLTGSQKSRRQETKAMPHNRAYYERQAAAALEGLKRLDEYGDDDWAQGAMLTWTKRFKEDGLPYTYAAVKCGNGKWATTSTRIGADGIATWEDLVDHWLQGLPTEYRNVWAPTELIPATEWEEAE